MRPSRPESAFGSLQPPDSPANRRGILFSDQKRGSGDCRLPPRRHDHGNHRSGPSIDHLHPALRSANRNLPTN